jgi:hypothetical protein
MCRCIPYCSIAGSPFNPAAQVLAKPGIPVVAGVSEKYMEIHSNGIIGRHSAIKNETGLLLNKIAFSAEIFAASSGFP